MRPRDPQTQTCPGCQRTVPGWAANCQFCNAALTPLASTSPPSAGPVRQTHTHEGLDWSEKAYIAASIMMLLYGLLMIGAGIFYANELAGGGILAVPGILTVIAGLGLLFHVEWLQTITKYWLILSLIFAIGSAVGGFAQYAYGQTDAWSGIFALGQIAYIGVMLWLIHRVADV